MSQCAYICSFPQITTYPLSLKSNPTSDQSSTNKTVSKNCTTPWCVHKMMQTDTKICHSTVSQQSNSISFKGTSFLRRASLCNVCHKGVFQTQIYQVLESPNNTLSTRFGNLTIWNISYEPTQHSVSLILFIPICQPSFYPP